MYINFNALLDNLVEFFANLVVNLAVLLAGFAGCSLFLLVVYFLSWMVM